MKRPIITSVILCIVMGCQACSAGAETSSQTEISALTSAVTEKVEFSYTAIDADRFASDIVERLTGFGYGEMGYNIKVTQCARDVYVSANDHKLWSADPVQVRQAFEREAAKLGEEGKQSMAVNYRYVEDLLDESLAGGQSISVFGDVDAEEEMRRLIFDADAHNSWVTLKEILDPVCGKNPVN